MAKVTKAAMRKRNSSSKQQNTRTPKPKPIAYSSIEPELNNNLNDVQYREPVENIDNNINVDQNQKYDESTITWEQKYEVSLSLQRELKAKYEKLEKANSELKLDLFRERESLVEKLHEKSREAQSLVDKKNSELELRKEEEIRNIRLSIFDEVVSAFIDPICLLESTISNSPSDPIIANYLQGFSMLSGMFKDKLEELGVEQISVNPGDIFNEHYMEAFDVVVNEDMPSNSVSKILKNGFAYKNKVLKHTLVIVTKKSN